LLKRFYYEFFPKQPKCRHERVSPIGLGKFCPDCGKEIFISWIILRCKCCSTKRQSIPRFDTFLPVEKYCSKCGSRKYYVEKKTKLEFYEFNYATLIREEFENPTDQNNKTQIWIEENNWSSIISPKLIPLFK